MTVQVSEADATRDLLRELPILRFLPGDARELVVDSFVPLSYPFGSEIVREGDPAEAFFVVRSGKARVMKRGATGEEISLSVLRPGDSFGEMGLLAHTTRTATIRASSDVEVMKLDRSVFEALLKARPEIRSYLELEVRHRQLHNFFREFTAFSSLPPASLQRLLSELVSVRFGKGSQIIREGDPPGPMFIVAAGRLRVFRAGPAGERGYLSFLRKGDFFGEISALHGVPRTASVEAVSDCDLLQLSRDTFTRLLDELPEFRAKVEQRIEQYDYRTIARVPLDFAEEMLPAPASVQEQVGPSQVESEAAAVSRNGKQTVGEPEFRRNGKRIRSIPMVRQIDEQDCGAACLAMICRHYGRAVSLARIRQLLHTGLDGTSLRALCHAASELGLAARAVRAEPHNLEELPLPAIAHWEGNHWVVVYDVDKSKVRFADPGSGSRTLTRAEFEEDWSGYVALFDYTDRFEQTPVQKRGFGWLLPFFQPYKSVLAQAVGLAVVVSMLQMILPVFTQIIVDRVVVEGDRALLNLMGIGMLASLAVMLVAIFVQRYLLSFIAVRIDSATLDYLTRRLLALPMSYFHSRRTGDIQRRLAGMQEIRQFFVDNGVSGIMALVQLAAVITLMLVYSVKLTLVFLAVAPAYLVLMYFSAKWLRPLWDDLETAYGNYQSSQTDAIKGIETVKSLGAEGPLRAIMLSEFNSVAKKRFKADFTLMTYEGAIQLINYLSLVVFLWAGAHMVVAGTLSIGALLAFNALVGLANSAILVLLWLWDDLQVKSVLVNRLNDVLETEPEQGSDRSRLLPVRTLDGAISFRNVSFRYGSKEAPAILDNITFDVPANKRIAIVGRSGSGKTTLVKLLAGLLEPTGGTIQFDGLDMRTLNYRELRRHIGFVLQDNHLFSDTIMSNIAFGEEEPDMDRVVAAAQIANAHEFITRLPLGYETKVGEAGLLLSGGQKQRVAIARAVYHRPPVLIFDEATSALDTESERALQGNMDRLLEGRTSFVIAHRLSTIRDADHIMVLERGKLVEHGSNDELMARQGLYFYLCSQQLQL